jgi:hypothetical protein
MNIRAKELFRKSKNKYTVFLSHPDEPKDNRPRYSLNGSQITNTSSNTQNIFDDSDYVNIRWLKRTRKYLDNLR